MLQFDCRQEYILENDRVRLSPLQLAHIPLLLDIANEPHIWDYSPIKGDGIENLTRYVQIALKNREAGKEYPFVVYDKAKQAYAGSTRYCELLPSLSVLRLGYTWYGTAFRGTGLNKHCKYLLFEYAFETMKAERIGLGAYIENEVSIAAMKSVGCQVEGVFRNHLVKHNRTERTDAILLSILKEEWEQTVKNMLAKKIGMVD